MIQARLLLTSLALALGLLATGLPSGGLLGVPSAAAQSTFADAKLAAFIEAAVAVNRLRDHWSQQIQSATSEAEAESLVNQANQQMAAAVDRTAGITMQEYLQIVEAAETDPDLSAKLAELYQQKVGN